MKNILKYALSIMLLAGSMAVTKADKIKIINDTDNQVYVALVTTKKGSKNKQIAFTGAGEYAKVPGTKNSIRGLGIHQAFDIENFKSSNKYDRTLWVSTDRNALSEVLDRNRISSEVEENVYAYEIGGFNKSVVIRSKPYGQTGFKFESYKILKPKLSNNATITDIILTIQVLTEKRSA